MLTRTRDALIEDLEQQVSSLSREVASLRKQTARRGAAAYDDASELVGELIERLMKRRSSTRADVMRGARAANRAAHQHPAATALIGVAALGLVAALLLRR